jgi:transcriptional regulator with XRE-family HTH domain
MGQEETRERPPVARNLRYLRDRDGLTQRAIADAIGVKERQIAEWVKDDGTYLPSWGNVLKLADLFKVPAEFFYRDNRESREP